MAIQGWYYLHRETKDLIFKGYEPESDSDFVEHVWEIDVRNRGDAWKVALEALALGAKIERIKELAKSWNLTKQDAFRMMKRVMPTELMVEGLRLFCIQVLELPYDPFMDEYANTIHPPGITYQHVNPIFCPFCNGKLTSSVGLDHKEAPFEGAPAICGQCGEIGVFNADKSFRKPTREEHDEFMSDIGLANIVNGVRKLILTKKRSEN